MTVEWRDIEGYEGFYQISSDGLVKSMARDILIFNNRIRRLPDRILKPSKNSNGYLRVSLCREGEETRFFVHRLVAITFLSDSYFPGAHVLHGDGNHLNNTVGNLRWGTPAENSADMIEHGHHHGINQTECKRGHPFTPENTYLSKNEEGGTRRTCRICQYLRRPRLSAPDLARHNRPPGSVRKPIRHGTPTGYTHGGCRCEECRSAMRDLRRTYRKRDREAMERAAS